MTTDLDRRAFLAASAATAVLVAAAPKPLSASTTRLQVIGLTTDYIDRPLGLENRNPKLSWRIESNDRNVKQSAYRILVASSKTALLRGKGDLWDSGKVYSSKSFGVAYQGRELMSRQQCWWWVQVWDEFEGASEPSAASWWEMGLLSQADWTAQWLAVEDVIARGDRETGLNWIWGEPFTYDPSRKFRFTFELPATASAGELFVVVNDLFWWMQITRIWIDGEPIAGPGVWIGTKDAPQIMEAYITLSRQHLTLRPLTPGRHVLAMEIGSRPISNLLGSPKWPDVKYVPGCAALLRLNLDDGTTLRLATGPQWKTDTVQTGDWYSLRHNDKHWSSARPAPVDGYQPWPAQPAMNLRREFSVEKSVVRARLYATALGAYEARLNGARVGDALLTPELTEYSKRVKYRVYDVTSMLRPGANALGLTVADGWYAAFDGRFAFDSPPRRVIAQLEMVFVDGSRKTVSTGSDWRTATSPLRFSELKIGEVYDARLEQPGWDRVGFDDKQWMPAQVGQVPSGRLVAQVSPPIRAMQVISPRTISQPKPGIYIVDFGQQLSGWCRLRVKGTPGSRIEIRYADRLGRSGELDQSASTGEPTGGPKKDVFILQGSPTQEALEPRFVYRGFRYVQIHGLQAAPDAGSLQGVFIHNDLPITGSFRSSDALLERLACNILQTQRCNTVGVLTDNAVRELRGFTGDAGIFLDTAAFNMDVCAFTSGIMDAISDEQLADGAFPMVAPSPKHGNAYFNGLGGSAPAWSDAGVIFPWTIWQRYGDTTLIERHWDAMDRYLHFIHANSVDFIWVNNRNFDFGDWLAPGGAALNRSTPQDLIATAYWAHSAELLSQMAMAIGRTQDAARLREIFESVRRSFNKVFVKADGTVGSGTQTSYVLALRFGLLTGDIAQAAAIKLAAEVRSRGTALTTGILGTQFILDVLADWGHDKLAYDLLLRTEFPSWGHMIRNGATSIWEHWDGKLGALAQPALGSVGGFLYRRVAGIEASSPGFETIVVRPLLDPRVKRGGTDYDSVMGRISVDWTQSSDEGFSMTVTIPANATARIHLPARHTSRITEGGRELQHCREMVLITWLDGRAVVAVGSGTYQFVVT
jgi:alpha-L-rhamnosidase